MNTMPINLTNQSLIRSLQFMFFRKLIFQLLTFPALQWLLVEHFKTLHLWVHISFFQHLQSSYFCGSSCITDLQSFKCMFACHFFSPPRSPFHVPQVRWFPLPHAAGLQC
ncbi:hypothetical protein K439DRAFT_1663784 [Ramaria rubella]|nr:hypothetical protein K439DRAFT_1663784 [Ramaria rubella]